MYHISRGLCSSFYTNAYCSVPGKHPCTAFQGVYVAASIQAYGSYMPDKRPCGPKSCLSALGHYGVCEMRLIGQQNVVSWSSAHALRFMAMAHGVTVEASIPMYGAHGRLPGTLSMVIATM